MPRPVLVQDAQVGVSSWASMYTASAARADATARIPATQPARNIPAAALGRGVKSRKIAGTTGTGDSAMPIASGTTSPITASTGFLLPAPGAPTITDGPGASGAQGTSAHPRRRFPCYEPTRPAAVDPPVISARLDDCPPGTDGGPDFQAPHGLRWLDPGPERRTTANPDHRESDSRARDCSARAASSRATVGQGIATTPRRAGRLPARCSRGSRCSRPGRRSCRRTRPTGGHRRA